MNVVAKVLPEIVALLLHFHIEKNERAKCITDYRVKPKPKDVKVDGKDKEVNEVKTSGIVNNITRVWDDVDESLTKDSFASTVMRFRDVCKRIPKFLDYVETTILNSVREKIVRAWIDSVLHLGCKTTNRVKSTQGKLKNYLRLVWEIWQHVGCNRQNVDDPNE